MPGCQAIVDAEDWNVKLNSPLSSIILMRTRVLTHEATTMEMNDGEVMVLQVLPGHSLVMKQSNLDMSACIVLILVDLESSVLRNDFLRAFNMFIEPGVIDRIILG